jgi:putative endonuclease
MLIPAGDHLKFGEWGEETAAQYLESRGYTILERRYRCPPQRGDLDLIVRVKFEGRDFIVFVEVKTRRSKDVRVGEAAVDWGKKKVMIKLARAFLQRLGRPTAWRYDVISVYPNRVPGGEPEIEHFIEAFHEQRA